MKNQKGFSVLELFLVLVIVLLLGFGAYYVAHKQRKSDMNTGNAASSGLFEQVRSKMASNYPNFKEDKQQEGFLDYKLPNYEFVASKKVDPDNSVAYVTKGEDIIDKYPSNLESDIKQILTNNGYSAESSQPGATDNVANGIGDKNLYFRKGSDVCQLSISTSSNPLVLACSDLDSLAKTAAIEREFYEGIKSSGSTANVIGEPNIQQSESSGYRTASVGISHTGEPGGAGALFYAKAGGPWIYFTSGQQGPSCEMYNTVDLRAAFKGKPCYHESNGEESMVQ